MKRLLRIAAFCALGFFGSTVALTLLLLVAGCKKQETLPAIELEPVVPAGKR